MILRQRESNKGNKLKRPPAKASKGTTNLPLHEIVAIAAYLAGASRKPIDTEDIAYKANEIAPGRFSWRKYKDQIKLDLIYKHLWDLTKPDKGEYITGTEKAGWLLTLKGTSFAERTVDQIDNLTPAREKVPHQEEAWRKRERARMLGEVAFDKFSKGKLTEVTPVEAEKFFRLDDYVVGAARERKIRMAENTFHNDPDLGLAILQIVSLVRGKE